VPITSRSEFEAVLYKLCLRVDKALTELGQVPSIEDAKRTLQQVAQSSKDGPRLKSLRAQLERACDSLIANVDDSKLRDDLWDCLDYVDYRA